MTYTNKQEWGGFNSDIVTYPSRIVIPKDGIYEIYYSIQIHKTQVGSAANIYVWLRKNGVDVPDTNGRTTIISNSVDSLPIVPYIIECSTGDILEMIVQGDAQYLQILYISDGSVPGPAIPSIIVGVKEI